MIKNYKGVAERFALILNELNNNDKISINKLVEITGSDKRNLQMDLNNRLKDPFHIDTDGKGFYWIDKKYQGLFTSLEFKHLAEIAGISELFPDFDKNFLKNIINQKYNNSFIIKSSFKDKFSDNPNFLLVLEAINTKKCIYVRYKNKTYDVVPYKLINNFGSWYLCVTHNKIIKTFKFKNVSNVRFNNSEYIVNDEIIKTIDESDSIWISNRSEHEKIIVKIQTIPEFTQYYIDNIKIPGEISRKNDINGRLIIEIEVNQFYEISSIIKYWIPRLEVIEPFELKELIKNELVNYTRLLE
ncbi:MAG: WYL domain-containing protein [Spirochaetales bacterium]|nr:WYL domain-containing protein [Spirochaetales bacterium]